MYKTVDDYEDEDVYETVLDYKKVMKDIFEERTENIEKFHISVADINIALISAIRLTMDEGIQNALNFAEQQVKDIKQQFKESFSKLDLLLASKYKELSDCASDQKEKEKTLADSRKQLAWIQKNIEEINSILDM